MCGRCSFTADSDSDGGVAQQDALIPVGNINIPVGFQRLGSMVFSDLEY